MFEQFLGVHVFQSPNGGRSAIVALDNALSRSANLSAKVDITTAIVDTIQAIAWPVAILAGVLFLRREIRALF